MIALLAFSVVLGIWKKQPERYFRHLFGAVVAHMLVASAVSHGSGGPLEAAFAIAFGFILPLIIVRRGYDWRPPDARIPLDPP